MPEEKSGLRVLDLYCGAGGFSEGFRQAGFDVVMGIDNWQTALDSHKINGLGDSLKYDMFKLVDEGGFEEAKRLAKEIQDKYGKIDVLIGSPPCTEFSYAKKGGKGDQEKGMLLVRAHLIMVAAIQPTFWLMENVPRLKTAIEQESTRENAHGWYVDLERLGVVDDLSDSHLIDEDTLCVPFGKIYTASDYGAPQGRKRFIAGNVNPESVAKFRTDKERFIGEIIRKLSETISNGGEFIEDPNYHHLKIKKELLRDHFYDNFIHPMYWEAMRHLKRRHIQYGKMAFPDKLERPARTIMATSNPSSREAVTLETGNHIIYQGKKRPLLRQPTVREVACIQGFPINFQFTGPSLTTRYKQIGNAVPCQLSRALALGLIDEFKKIQAENDAQSKRLRTTISRIKKSKDLPIIRKSQNIVDEAKDFGDHKYMEFRARPNKHIRRKLLSAKPWNTSAVLIFENTEWNEEGKRLGGFWKSCIQLGQGKQFSQVYLDEKSVGIILDSITAQLEESGQVQTKLDAFDVDSAKGTETNITQDDHISQLRHLLKKMLKAVDNGIPIVPDEWFEFPGYSSTNTEKYLKMKSLCNLSLPSADSFQEMFTTDYPNSKNKVGPIDLFDGLDFLMLGHLSKPSLKWIHEKSITFDNLRDIGEILHNKRISESAINLINGNVPLVTIIGSLLSVHILHRMHEQGNNRNLPLFKSLDSGWKTLQAWCQP